MAALYTDKIEIVLGDSSYTDWTSPGTVVSDDSVGTIAWSDPSNATASDNSYADAFYDSEYAYGLVDYVVKLVDESGDVVGNNKATDTNLDTSDTYRIYGGSDDLWGGTWSDTDVNDSDFGVVFQVSIEYLSDTYTEYLKATDFDLSIPSGATIDGIEVRVEQKYVYTEPNLPPPPAPPTEGSYNIYIDHIQIRVSYTESSGTEADSERSLYLEGYDTNNSERGLYTQGYLTNNSERSLYIDGFVSDLYSRESASDLESDDSVLTTQFSEQDYTDVGTDNDTYVDLQGTAQYMKFLFQEVNDNETNEQKFDITWKGKSSLAPSSATVYLQIYNRTDEIWETLDSDNSSSADTKFTLSGTQSTDLSDYYDENYIISARVYQEVI